MYIHNYLISSTVSVSSLYVHKSNKCSDSIGVVNVVNITHFFQRIAMSFVLSSTLFLEQLQQQSPIQSQNENRNANATNVAIVSKNTTNTANQAVLYGVLNGCTLEMSSKVKPTTELM